MGLNDTIIYWLLKILIKSNSRKIGKFVFEPSDKAKLEFSAFELRPAKSKNLQITTFLGR